MLTYLIIHLILSIMIALIATLILKERFKEHFLILFFSLFIFNLLLPIVAYIATIVLSPLLAYSPKKQYLHQVKHFNKEEFFSNPYPKIQRLFGESAVVSLATDPNNHSPNKMKGLVFMAKHPNRQTHMLTRGLLSDRDNEIRLYSFSLLSAKEQQLNERITQLIAELEKTADKSEQSRLKGALAENYWEFVYQGLTEAENIPIMIEKVEHFAKEALLGSQDKAPLFLLLAKSFFTHRDYTQALHYFQAALQAGIPRVRVLPYLAEIAFEKRAFKEVRHLMQELQTNEIPSRIAPLQSLWSVA